MDDRANWDSYINGLGKTYHKTRIVLVVNFVLECIAWKGPRTRDPPRLIYRIGASLFTRCLSNHASREAHCLRDVHHVSAKPPQSSPPPPSYSPCQLSEMNADPQSSRNLPWKGKSRARDSQFSDLNPTITYRHILSQNLGVKDPLRVVALCDSDAFYAACEMNRLGVSPDEPLVVLQWESLIAVNYAARKYGISRMDKKKDALKRCPHLRVVHVATYKEGEAEPGYWENVDTNTHKVSLDYYRRESMKIAALFREMLPGCEVGMWYVCPSLIQTDRHPAREGVHRRGVHRFHETRTGCTSGKIPIHRNCPF